MSFTLLQTSKCDEFGTHQLSHCVNFDVWKRVVEYFDDSAFKEIELKVSCYSKWG